MAYYKGVFRRTDKTKSGKYYPTAVTVGCVTTDELCDEIVEISTVSLLGEVIGKGLAYECTSNFSQEENESSIAAIIHSFRTRSWPFSSYRKRW